MERREEGKEEERQAEKIVRKQSCFSKCLRMVKKINLMIMKKIMMLGPKNAIKTRQCGTGAQDTRQGAGLRTRPR